MSDLSKDLPAIGEYKEKLYNHFIDKAPEYKLDVLKADLDNIYIYHDENRITSYNVCYTKLLRTPSIGEKTSSLSLSTTASTA